MPVILRELVSKLAEVSNVNVENTLGEFLDLLPQRHPFLFVDQVSEVTNNSISTSLTLSGEEDFFGGHFPGNPIMPGVLLQEALFQSSAILMGHRAKNNSAKEEIQKVGVVASVSKAKFKKNGYPW